MHRLAAEELAHRGAQHGAAVGGARIGRGARALELQLPALARRVDGFAQGDGAPVTELPGPVAELVPAVVGRIGLHALEQRVAAEDLRKLRRGDGGFVDAQQRRHFGRMRDEPRRGDRLGLHPRVQRPVHLPPLRANVGIGRQLADEAVVEAEGLQGAGCRRGERGEIVHLGQSTPTTPPTAWSPLLRQEGKKLALFPVIVCRVVLDSTELVENRLLTQPTHVLAKSSVDGLPFCLVSAELLRDFDELVVEI